MIAKRGQHQVGKITSGERSKTITAVCCYNAASVYLPPPMIFPRVNMNDQLLKGAPQLTVGAASKSGWTDAAIFKRWFDHFVGVVKPPVEDPHLLLLDGHVSHKSLELIALLSFPPRTTHVLQPLDAVFFEPLKTYYHQACDSFMMRNLGKRITEYDVATLFNTAYMSRPQQWINVFLGSNEVEFIHLTDTESVISDLHRL